jgi:hypothetical protein
MNNDPFVNGQKARRVLKLRIPFRGEGFSSLAGRTDWVAAEGLHGDKTRTF